MTRERIDELRSMADDGCLLAPTETYEVLDEIQRLRESMRESMNDKNANPDAASVLGSALGYGRSSVWDEWDIPEVSKPA